MMRLRGIEASRILWIQDRYLRGIAEVAGARATVVERFIHSMASRLGKQCDAVVVIHERWEREVAGQFPALADRLHTIRNWTHVSAPESIDVDGMRSELGWGSVGNEIVVLHAGNMGVKQDLENVVGAARLADQRGLPLRFVLMGDGSQRERLEELGLGIERLQLLPPQDNDRYMQVLGSADVLLVNEKPGMLSAAVPSKMTSYFATGRPVLAATDTASVTADEIRGSEAGVVCRPGDPAELLASVTQVCDLVSAGSLSGGPDFVESRLSKEAAVEGFLKLINGCNGIEDVDKKKVGAQK